jgi:hypothetical protein
MCLGDNDSRTTRHTQLEELFMGQVVSLAQHQATKQMQIREAESEAQAALQKASQAYRRLHELKGE